MVLTIQHQIVLGLDLLSELATGEFGEITLYGLNKLPGAGAHGAQETAPDRQNGPPLR